MKNIFKNLSIALIFALMFAATAQAAVKIIAVVNGESITNTQLDQRVNIIVASAGLQNDAATKEKVRKQAIEILINEILQKQEAANLGIQLSPKEFDYAIKDLEEKNNIKPGGFKNFVQSKGISYDGTIAQIKAGLTWKKVISRMIQPKIFVTEEEIEAKRKSYSTKDKKSEAEVSEIIVSIDYGDEKGAKAKADEIVKKARAGEDFAKLAKEYSIGKTAKNGGYVGVINEQAIKGPLKDILAETKSNSISEPRKLQGFFVILKVGERRTFDPVTDKDQLKNIVMMDKIEQESKAYIKKLREKSYIERRDN